MLFYILVLGIAYVVGSSFLNYRKLPHVGGPFLAKIGPFWLLYHTLKGDLYLRQSELIEKYGSPACIAPDFVIHDDPEVVRQVYAPRSPFAKGRWYDAMRLGADRDNVMTIFDEKLHGEKRAKLIPGYSREVVGVEAAASKFISQLISVIRRDGVEANKAIDFAQLAGFLTLDVLTKIAFNLEIGYLKDNKDHFDYLKSMQEFVPIMDLCCNHPAILKILNSKIVMSVLKPKPEDKLDQGALIGKAHAAVAEHFKDTAKDDAGTMIASWKRHGVTQPECQDETMLLILAGSDSTATALRSTFLHVATNPRVYAALNKEIDEALERGAISFPVITLEEAQALPYLSAVIKEGLRIFSPLHGLSGRYTTSPYEINGKMIPAGIEVGVDWYGMPRAERNYGPDSKEFRPERWLEEDATTLKKYEQNLYLVFAGGKSACLGKQIALMELHKTIFELIRNFDFSIVNPVKPMDIGSHSVVTVKNLWTRATSKRTS